MQTNTDIITILIISTTIVILLFITITLIILYAYKKKQESYINYLKELEIEFEKNTLKARLEIQEQTFEHLSREIHDNIGLSLTLAKLNLTTIEHGTTLHMSENIHNSIELISTSLQELRNISHSFNSDLIKNSGLIKAIEEEIIRVNKIKMISFSFETIGQSSFLDTQKELIIYRIIQEGINNIIKHSGAEKAKIILNYFEKYLQVNIIDDGKGFDYSKNQSSKGSGILNMKSRAHLINGSFSIDSNSSGSNIQLTIPI